MVKLSHFVGGTCFVWYGFILLTTKRWAGQGLSVNVCELFEGRGYMKDKILMLFEFGRM